MELHHPQQVTHKKKLGEYTLESGAGFKQCDYVTTISRSK